MDLRCMTISVCAQGTLISRADLSGAQWTFISARSALGTFISLQTSRIHECETINEIERYCVSFSLSARRAVIVKCVSAKS